MAQRIRLGMIPAVAIGVTALAWIALQRASAAPAPDTGGSFRVEVVETAAVVPGPGLPPQLPVLPANNNLDAVRHDGRVYLAFRTAPDHYASADAAIQVLSSADERTWRRETRVHVGADLREPRLLSWRGTLFLYVAQLGTDRFDFEPDRALRLERDAAGAWSGPATFRGDGFVPWRLRVEQGRPLLIGYSGGASMYDWLSPGTVRIELLTSDDGRTWRPLDPTRPVVLEGGGSEADLLVQGDGAISVVRNELGDPAGFGSKVCHAPAGSLSRWTCRSDPRKFDSPLLFRHGAEVFLLARRSLGTGGRYDLGLHALPEALQHVVYEAAYVASRKRCSLWRWDRASGDLRFVLDLPSRGDTCFPAVLPGATDDELVVYDYSSDLASDPPWVVGQQRPTSILRHVLRFTRVATRP